MSVWDPTIKLVFNHTTSQAAGEEWVSPVYTLPPDEVLEVYRMEIVPPVSAAGTIRKLRYVTIMIDGKEVETIRANSIMLPAEHQYNAGVAVDLGVPYLHRPITGVIPSPIEATCPKVKKGQTLGVKTVADEAIADTEPYSIVLKAARVRKEDKLREIVGVPVISVSFILDGDSYMKSPIPVSLDTFDELPGGLAQSKPQIFPFITWASNKVATTPNTWYDFDYPANVAHSWQNLSWNLVNKTEAYLIRYLAVIPHSNSKAARLFTEGRITNPEFPTRPLPEENYFYPPMYFDTSVNANLKRAGPVPIKPPYLFHGVKGGIQVIDNGTSIPANGVIVEVYGTKFELR